MKRLAKVVEANVQHAYAPCRSFRISPWAASGCIVTVAFRDLERLLMARIVSSCQDQPPPGVELLQTLQAALTLADSLEMVFVAVHVSQAIDICRQCKNMGSSKF